MPPLHGRAAAVDRGAWRPVLHGDNYRIYDDRVGETTPVTYRPNHEWYRFPQQKPTEVSMLKCYDLGDRSLGFALIFAYRLHRPEHVSQRPMRKNVVVFF